MLKVQCEFAMQIMVKCIELCVQIEFGMLLVCTTTKNPCKMELQPAPFKRFWNILKSYSTETSWILFKNKRLFLNVFPWLPTKFHTSLKPPSTPKRVALSKKKVDPVPITTFQMCQDQHSSKLGDCHPPLLMTGTLIMVKSKHLKNWADDQQWELIHPQHTWYFELVEFQ